MGRKSAMGPGNTKGIKEFKKHKKTLKKAVEKAILAPVHIKNPGCPFPQEFKTKIRFSNILAIGATSGVGSFAYVYGPSASTNQINNLKGVICPYLSEVFALYNRYRPERVKYLMHLHQSSGNPSNVSVAFVNGAVPTYSGTITYLDLPFSRFTNVVAYQPTKLSGSIALNKLAGVSLTEYKTADRFQATTSGSPSELMNLIWCADNQYSASQTVYLLVRVELTVTFMDPISLSS